MEYLAVVAETEAGWEERSLCPLSAVAVLYVSAEPPTTECPAVPLLLALLSRGLMFRILADPL